MEEGSPKYLRILIAWSISLLELARAMADVFPSPGAVMEKVTMSGSIYTSPAPVMLRVFWSQQLREV